MQPKLGKGLSAIMDQDAVGEELWFILDHQVVDGRVTADYEGPPHTDDRKFRAWVGICLGETLHHRSGRSLRPESDHSDMPLELRSYVSRIWLQ